MKRVYINGLGSISSQKTFDNTVFLDEIVTYEDNVIAVIDPNYKEFIPPAAARRMAKGIKMGIVASKIALADAGRQNVDAVITGTGFGCTIDSEKFLGNLIDNKEEYLTPTSFIQSTHNTVAGQIALNLGCQGHNFTYVHANISFESALIDAFMQLQNEEENNILIGGIDESGQHTIKIQRLIHHIKKEAIKSTELLNSNTKGTVFSEGANFFVLSNEQQASSYAEHIATGTFNTLSKENLPQAITSFLKENKIDIDDVDAIVLGNNGDIAYDSYYHVLSEGIFKNTQQLYYKHLCGEFFTASSFGFWLASKILKTQRVPEAVKLNDKKSADINTILLYNQYRGENHSFTLLKKC
ncbi:3-oxoacyl-[acyl-carrier protein] reductase [hydrothermal vent metagenome]|uniref:3-oxoacyl-[acyl-carrier protein] reductase n=1 Tax=hydrothermal vent metagenome TaxID=652676 RepID=A0A3B0TI49_9ZZZZ